MLFVLLACRGEEVETGPEFPDDPEFEELRSWTGARMVEWGVPGVALAVVEDGKLSHLEGLGVRQFGEEAPVTGDTLFRAGSISKMFTGALVAQAAADGLLDLDAPASTVLDGLTLYEGSSFDDFTLMQLAGHTSGMQTSGLPNECDTDPDHLEAVMAELAPGWALWTPPGLMYNYANQGYGLLGLALERVKGETFLDQVTGLLDAADMETATYDWEVATDREHATGHTLDPATGEPMYYRTFDERACVASYPSGGLMASARDLAHVAEILLADGAGWMTPAAWEIMTLEGYARSETSGYGFGLKSSDYRGHRSLLHHGSVGGYYAMLWVLPDDGLGVVVLVNADVHTEDPWQPNDKPTERIMRHALDTYLGLEEEVAESSALEVSEWSRFVGTWHSDYEMGDVSVTLDGEQLTYTDADGAHPLLPYSASSFIWADPYDDGRVSYPAISFRERADDGTYEWITTGEGAASWSGK